MNFRVRQKAVQRAQPATYPEPWLAAGLNRVNGQSRFQIAAALAPRHYRRWRDLLRIPAECNSAERQSETLRYTETLRYLEGHE